MTDIALSNELVIRVTAFASILAAVAAWEAVAPRREQRIGRRCGGLFPASDYPIANLNPWRTLSF